jgi:hypothetical protein
MSLALASAVTDFRRRALLRTLIASPSADPLAEAAGHEALWEVFEDETDLLRSLQQLWFDALSRRVYAEPRYPLGTERVREVYTELAAEHPVLRSVLDSHQDHSGIADDLQDERVLLARAAGHLRLASPATLSWRARDLIDQLVPAQRQA